MGVALILTGLGMKLKMHTIPIVNYVEDMVGLHTSVNPKLLAKEGRRALLKVLYIESMCG